MLRTSLLSLILLCWLTPAAQEVCSSSYDGNDDGQVGITDLLGLLTVFGDMDLDDDGIWDSQDDCIDLSACNYDLSPTEACKYIDACGVCGGLGAIYECGCSDKPDGDCDCDGNELDAIGVCGGNCEIDSNLNGVCDDVEGCSDPAACNYQEGNIDPFTSFVGPCLQLDTHKVHIDGPLAGMVTYRLYFHPVDHEDITVAVQGDGVNPLVVESTDSFYQHPLGSPVATAISTLLYPSFPELQYDSWVTISYSPEDGLPEQQITTFASNENPWVSTFEGGGSIVMNTISGGLWGIQFGGIGTMGLADSVGRTLVGQFTTAGAPSATMNVGLHVDSPSGNELYQGLSTQSCTQSDLCTYPDAQGNCD